MQKDYYKILEIAVSASHEEIKKSFHKLAMKYHPDRTGGNAGYMEKFKEINEAYGVLSDPAKKNRYDLGLNIIYISPAIVFEPYLEATVESRSALVNEEFEITYRYAGEGRVFRKPAHASLVYLASPVVHHNKINIANSEIKETWLTYTVCALHPGMLVIPPASIYINNKQIYSPALTVSVHNNSCYFSANGVADIHPYPVYLNKEVVVSSSYRRSFTYRQLVLVPRSAYAYYYHQIGASLKVVFTLMGFVMALIYHFHPITGLLAGSLTGGLLCHSMYLFAGIKSKFLHALRYSDVEGYLNMGYRAGRDPSYGLLNSRIFYTLVGAFR